MANFKYNNNPFVPQGRLSGIMYFIYTVLFALLCWALGIDFFVSNPIHLIRYFALIAVFLLVLPQLFILKKRIFDICLNNRVSWILTAVLFVLFIISFAIGLLLFSTILYLLLLFLPKHETLLKIWKH